MQWLFDELLDAGGDGHSIAVVLMGMYVYGDRSRLEGLRPQLRALAARVGQRPGQKRSQLDPHHFKELVGWILEKGRDDRDAAAVALTLAKEVAAARDNDSDLVKPLLPLLLRHFPEIVWPILGEAIVSDRKNAWVLELSLGDRFAFDAKRPALMDLPEEVLFAWCHAHPDKAPAFVAGLVPILTSRRLDDPARALHPHVVRLLDEFGDRQEVLEALVRNTYNFGWSGSLADYFALHDAPLRSLETHPHGAVRRWAAKTREAMQARAADARTEEDERNADWGN